MSAIARKTILLTGATGGIGAVLARALARQKATVVGVGLSPERLARLQQELNSIGGKGFSIPFNLKNCEDLPALVQQVHALAGPVDILINNAGNEKYRSFSHFSLLEMREILEINLLAALELSRLLLPSWLSHGQGHIVNMASLAAKKGSPYNSVYTASKAGLLLWSDALRQELRGTGVKVSVICPGYVSEVGMFAQTGVPAPKGLGTTTPEALTKRVLRAIERDRREVIVNRDLLTESTIKFLLALGQFCPILGDRAAQSLGVAKLNQMRVPQTVSQETLVRP